MKNEFNVFNPRTNLAHYTKKTRMDLKGTLRNLQVENKCTCKKRFEYEKKKSFLIKCNYSHLYK